MNESLSSSGVPQRVTLESWDHYILVIEDDPAVRDLYRFALRAGGYAVIGVQNGFDAVRLIEMQTPSVVVLDLTAPRLDGLAVQRSLKSKPHTRDIPVVVVTGTDIRELNLGDCACVLRKPIRMEALVVAVEHAVRHSAQPSSS